MPATEDLEGTSGQHEGNIVIGVCLGIRQRGLKTITTVSSSADSIGFAIARRLAQDGAHVVISSRKQENVDEAVAMLKEEGLSVTGTVCHVGKAEDRQHLVTTVRSYRLGEMKRHGSNSDMRESGSLGL